MTADLTLYAKWVQTSAQTGVSPRMDAAGVNQVFRLIFHSTNGKTYVVNRSLNDALHFQYWTNVTATGSVTVISDSEPHGSAYYNVKRSN